MLVQNCIVASVEFERSVVEVENCTASVPGQGRKFLRLPRRSHIGHMRLPGKVLELTHNLHKICIGEFEDIGWYFWIDVLTIIERR